MLLVTSLIPPATMVSVLLYLGLRGFHVINWEFLAGFPRFAGQEGGILPAIIGSLYVTGICLLVAVPLGVGAAIYLAEYAPDNLLTRIARFFIACLAGMPSIVIGLFGYTFLVHELKLGFSVLAGGLALAFMILPWTVVASEESIKAVPKEFKDASLALGATKWQTIKDITIKTAMPGIITGILLGFGKAIGETAVVLFTAGMGVGAFLPLSPFDPARTLPVHLYILATQSNTSAGFDRAYGTALTLLTLFTLSSIAALLVRRRFLRWVR